MDSKILDQFDFLKKFENSFSKLESIQKYINSEKYPKDHYFFGP